MGTMSPHGCALPLCPAPRSEFNAKWHIEGEEKDEEERQAKAALKAKGEEDLRGHLTMKSQQVAKKKETNRWVGVCAHTCMWVGGRTHGLGYPFIRGCAVYSLQ